MNKVGTFGVSCASYEDFGGWDTGDPPSARTRVLDLLLYADDLESLGVGSSGRRRIPLSYCFMSLLGFPFKWAKT